MRWDGGSDTTRVRRCAGEMRGDAAGRRLASALFSRPSPEAGYCGEKKPGASATQGADGPGLPTLDLCPFDGKNKSYYYGHIDTETVMQKIAAAQFKAQCLAVMDQVSQSGRPVVITKHGKAVVKLVPAHEGADEIFGALAGIARITGDIEKTVPASDWGVE